MLKLGRVTKVKVLFLVLVFVFNFDLFKFSAAILEKGLLTHESWDRSQVFTRLQKELFSFVLELTYDLCSLCSCAYSCIYGAIAITSKITADP